MSILLYPKYSNIFPNEKIPDIDEILKDIPSRMTLGIIGYISGKMYIKDDLKTQVWLMQKLIERTSEDTQKIVKQNLVSFGFNIEDPGYYLFPLYILMNFVEYEILNYRDIDFTNSTGEQEYNIFKALLWFNEQADTRKSNTEYKGGDRILSLLWEQSLPQIEFIGTKLFLNQLYVGIQFIDYLEKLYPNDLESYLRYLNISSKKDIFKNILEFFIHAHNKKNQSFINNFPTDILDKNQLLKPLILDMKSLDIEKYKKHNNHLFYKGLRKWPLIQHNNSFFDVINWNFVSDKITPNALIFDFYYNSTVKDHTSFPDYKTNVGINFSEKQIFRSLISDVFINKEYVHLDDDAGDHVNVDYYLRHGNIIMLFEYKDYIVPDRVKYGEYPEIKKYIDEHFISSATKKPKGITQLFNQIVTLDANTDLFENYTSLSRDPERFIVFPIIVTKDTSFTIPGLNHYLDKRLNSLLRQRRFKFHSIRPLTILDINFFIDFADDIMEEKIFLPTLLHNYFNKLCYLKTGQLRHPTPNNHIRAMSSFHHVTEPGLEKKLITESKLFKDIIDILEIPK